MPSFNDYYQSPYGGRFNGINGGPPRQLLWMTDDIRDDIVDAATDNLTAPGAGGDMVLSGMVVKILDILYAGGVVATPREVAFQLAPRRALQIYSVNQNPFGDITVPSPRFAQNIAPYLSTDGQMPREETMEEFAAKLDAQQGEMQAFYEASEVNAKGAIAAFNGVTVNDDLDANSDYFLSSEEDMSDFDEDATLYDSEEEDSSSLAGSDYSADAMDGVELATRSLALDSAVETIEETIDDINVNYGVATKVVVRRRALTIN